MTVTQVTEAENSNNMEKFGFIKSLKFLRSKKVKVGQITTDRHTQIRKYRGKMKKALLISLTFGTFAKILRKDC